MNQLGFKPTTLLSLIKIGGSGKPIVANALFRKGKAFLSAAELIKKTYDEPTQYVARHLVCQGLEIILKALLLLKDYDKYAPELPKKRFGHNLAAIVEEVVSVWPAAVCRELGTSAASEGQ